MLRPKALNADQYQARLELTLWRHFQYLVSDPCPCHQLKNFFRLNRLCRLKTNEHVRSSFYAVVCIILNVSVDLERFCRRLSNMRAKPNDCSHLRSIWWRHYEINIAKRCRQKIPLTLPSKVQMKWHFRVTSHKC